MNNSRLIEILSVFNKKNPKSTKMDHFTCQKPTKRCDFALWIFLKKRTRSRKQWFIINGYFPTSVS